MHLIRTRTVTSPLEIRDSRRLVFYPAIFNAETTVMDFRPGSKERTQFREVVRPGAFKASITSGQDVMANVDHQDDKTFARTRTGELVLQEDPKGLFASAWIPESPLGDQLIKDIEAGVLVGGSFRSRIIEGGDVWDGDLCQVMNAPLIDVCITANPAYKTTEVKLRTAQKYLELFRRLRLLKLKT